MEKAEATYTQAQGRYEIATFEFVAVIPCSRICTDAYVFAREEKNTIYSSVSDRIFRG